MATPKFLNVAGSTFHQELKKRVNDYFTAAKKPATGNFGLYFKAILFWASYVFLYVHVKICRCYLFLVLQTPYKLLILSFLSLFVISFPSSSQMQWQSRFSNISFFLSLFLDICIRYLLECLPFLILSYLHLFINFVKFRYFL